MSASAASLAVSRPAVASLPAELTTTVEAMPYELQRVVQKVENWRLENKRKAMWDGLKLWSLKAPAIIVAGGSSVVSFVAAKLGLGDVSSLTGFLTGLLGICVVLDGMLHPGQHRNLRLRASSDLQTLQDRIEFRWAQRNPNISPNEAAQQILADVEKKWEGIAACLNGAQGVGPQDQDTPPSSGLTGQQPK